MCLSPLLIVNKSRMYSGKVDCLTHFHDTTSQYIYVNCGVCPECLRKKQMYLVQRCQLESIDNYLYFATFTYSDKTLPSVDINGYLHYYASVKDFQDMMKRVRKHSFFVGRKFKYLYVSEYGSKKHRPHFHAIFFIPKSRSDTVFTPLHYERVLRPLFLSEWRRNVGSSRCPNYIPLCDYTTRFVGTQFRSNYDLHFVNPSLSSGQESDVAFYVSKYCLKYDKWFDDKRKALYLNLPPDEYSKYMAMIKPSVRYSKFFGLSPSSRDYLRHCIEVDSSQSLFPLFRNPLTGQLFPMSPYLFNKVGTLEDKYNFYYRAKNPDSFADSFHFSNIDYDEYKNRLDKYFRQNSLICSSD